MPLTKTVNLTVHMNKALKYTEKVGKFVQKKVKWECCPWHENAVDLFGIVHYLYFISACLPEFCAKP